MQSAFTLFPPTHTLISSQSLNELHVSDVASSSEVVQYLTSSEHVPVSQTPITELSDKEPLTGIISLDAASGGFIKHSFENRLNHKSAKVVHAIHTDIGWAGVGLAKPYGTHDFYVNGGKDQPTKAKSE